MESGFCVHFFCATIFALVQIQCATVLWFVTSFDFETNVFSVYITLLRLSQLTYSETRLLRLCLKLLQKKHLLWFKQTTIGSGMWKSFSCEHLTFPIFRNFLPNHGRILPALTHNGSQPLNVNAGRILPGFGRKLRNIGKLEWLDSAIDLLVRITNAIIVDIYHQAATCWLTWGWWIM